MTPNELVESLRREGLRRVPAIRMLISLGDKVIVTGRNMGYVISTGTVLSRSDPPMKKSRIHLRVCVQSVLAVGILTFGGIVSKTEAADISWGAPTTISGESDISTNGTPIGAANLRVEGIPSSSNPSPTVNGVDFTAWRIYLDDAPSGVFSFGTTEGGFISGANPFPPPFGDLSIAYQDLLLTGGHIGGGGTSDTLTISGLTAGQTYEFQWWSCETFPVSPGYGMATATAGNSVTLNANLTNRNGGLGQFAIGVFTADAPTQSVTFSDHSGLDAMQLRQIPEPTALGLLGFAFVFYAERRGRLIN